MPGPVSLLLPEDETRKDGPRKLAGNLILLKLSFS